MNIKSTRFASFAIVASVIAAAACSAPDPTLPSSSSAPASGASTAPGGSASGTGAAAEGSTSGTAGTGGTGPAMGYAGPDAARLSIRLVDAPTDQVTSIVVTVAKIEALLPAGWTTIVDQEQTVDLLTLQNGQFLALGLASLPPGHVGQLRLVLAEGGDQHVVTPDGVTHPLAVPSGEQSGIKLVGGFDVPGCGTGQVTMDFDGKHSLQVVSAGKNADRWSMRPVIRLKSVVTRGTCADAGAELDADTDGGSEAESDASAPEDPCANVTCADTETCENGSCRISE